MVVQYRIKKLIREINLAFGIFVKGLNGYKYKKQYLCPILIHWEEIQETKIEIK